MFKRSAGIVLGACASLILLFNACLSPGNGNSEKVPVEPSSMFFERAHHFCSDHIEDRFLIGYYGDALLNNSIHLFVVSHKGDTIYRDEWKAEEFLPAESASNSKEDQVDLLEKRMRSLVETSPEAGDTSDVSVREMKLGPVFAYSVNGEDRKIAFSRARKAVVVL